MIAVLQFPGFDPVLVEFGPFFVGWFEPLIHQLGPFAIRWYALAYIVSLVLGWRIVRRLVRLAPPVATVEQTDDFLTWATLGVVIGGRLGYVLFYQPSFYLAAPLNVFRVWDGGMSFHGGALGVITALFLFSRREGLPWLGFADRVCTIVPMGLGLGRIANFINGELWGRAAPDWLPWAMVFPRVDDLPRHPSQLYQAGLEGVVSLCITAYLCSRPSVRARFGVISGAFLICYGISRIIGEFFREPDPFLGFLFGGATMGQLLSVPMILIGLFLIVRARPVSVAYGAA